MLIYTIRHWEGGWGGSKGRKRIPTSRERPSLITSRQLLRRWRTNQQVVSRTRSVFKNVVDGAVCWTGRQRGSRGKSKDSTNNLYNYHHLLLFLPGKETLHPFVAMAPGSVTSKLIITIKISSSAREREAGGKLEAQGVRVLWKKKIKKADFFI